MSDVVSRSVHVHPDGYTVSVQGGDWLSAVRFAFGVVRVVGPLLPGAGSRSISLDARGADAGAEARVRAAMATSEECAKREILESMDRLQGRPGEGDANV